MWWSPDTVNAISSKSLPWRLFEQFFPIMGAQGAMSAAGELWTLMRLFLVVTMIQDTSCHLVGQGWMLTVFPPYRDIYLIPTDVFS